MLEKIKVSATFKVSPNRIYKAWLNSKEHGQFTESKVKINSIAGSNFTAGNGYISGKNILLEPNKRIVQSWRSTDFPVNSCNSTLEIIFKEVKNGTKFTLIHSDLPEGQGDEYKEGWKEFYIKPMKKYFNNG